MKPKLLLVSDTYHPQVDGTVRFIEEFIKRGRDSFDISLLVPQFGQAEESSKESIIYLPISRWLKPLPTYPSVRIFSWRTWWRISKAVQAADILFVQGPALASFLAILFAHYWKKPCFLYLHVIPWELFEQGVNIPGKHLLARLLKRVVLVVYNKCTLVLLPYLELEQQLRQKGLQAPTKITKLGIDIERFSAAERKDNAKAALGISKDKKVVGYVGRISPEKNVKLLLKAFLKLPHQQHLLLLLVGDGDPRLIEECKTLTNCRVTGFVRNVEDFLKAMDVFVMPSLTETTSLATLEAMASGIPVLTTKVGFMQQYVTKGYNGFFFPRRSANILSLKLEKLLRNQPLRRTLGQNARKTIAYSFSWERSITKIRRLLLEHTQEKLNNSPLEI